MSAALPRAFDLPASEYALGPLRIRPYSMAAHRRAESMELVAVAAGMETARALLSPPQLCREMDALYWLLAAPLPEVRAAFVAGGAAAAWRAAESQTIPPGGAGGFAAHIDWLLGLCRAALFDVLARELPGGADAVPPPEPPPDLRAPSRDADLVVSLCQRLGVGEEHLLEWVPFPRVLQYAHALRWQDPYVWTVAPRALAPDPYGETVPPDPGYGEAVEF